MAIKDSHRRFHVLLESSAVMLAQILFQFLMTAPVVSPSVIPIKVEKETFSGCTAWQQFRFVKQQAYQGLYLVSY
jgi:hypothetical protein